MAADAGRRCLSDLPDDLLLRILFFAPAKEAASTSVLSRQWRSLWRSSGAVNLDTRSFEGAGSSSSSRRRSGNTVRKSFLRGAKKALAAAQVTVWRLTIFIAEDSKIDLTRFDDEHSLVDAVLANRAARRVEELRIKVDDINTCQHYKLSFRSLPSRSLRALRLDECRPLKVPSGAAFPRLADLHLRSCTVTPTHLQRILDAAPQLATLHLEYIFLEVDTDGDDGRRPKAERRYRIHSPAVTSLAFTGCSRRWGGRREEMRIKVDMPRLQCFTYAGDIHLTRQLSLKSQEEPNMIQVDLHLSYDHRLHDDKQDPIHNLFWKFIQNFSTAKRLKLKLDFYMDFVALADKESREEILGSSSLFCLLERLELEAAYDPASKTSMVMLGNMLHCCPMLRNLQVKFSGYGKMRMMRSYDVDKEAEVDFDKSVDRFRRRKRPMVSPGGEDDDTNDQAWGDIPGLSEHSFGCLQSYLRRVSLHFCMKEPNCLGVQLAKFFAHKAMLLEEMYIDDGSQRLCEHTNPSVRRWIGNSAKRRRLDVAILP